MKITNYFYLKSEDDLKLLFELITDNYNSVKKDEKKSEVVKFIPDAVGRTSIIITWKLRQFIMSEDVLESPTILMKKMNEIEMGTKYIFRS